MSVENYQSKDELKKLKDKGFELYLEGYSMTEIAEKVDRDISRISRWAMLGDWKERRKAILQGEDDPAETNAIVILPDHDLTEDELEEHIGDLSRGMLHLAKEAVIGRKIDFRNPYQIMIVLEWAARELHLRKGEPTNTTQVTHLGVLSENDKKALREGLHLLVSHQQDVIEAEVVPEEIDRE